jgi:hypothetical protein
MADTPKNLKVQRGSSEKDPRAIRLLREAYGSLQPELPPAIGQFRAAGVDA